jgi:DNA-binding NarL/FixJ family response regulator
MPQLVAAIDVAAAGGVSDPVLTDNLNELGLVADPYVHARLTGREQAVLTLVGRGFSNIEIGLLLGVSARTVHFHRTNIRLKLSIGSDAELVRVAVMTTQY